MVLEHNNNSQNMDLECTSVWRATCKESQRKMKGFRGSVVLEHINNSQKLDLEWASVWRAKCKKFKSKMKGCRGQWCWSTATTRRNWT